MDGNRESNKLHQRQMSEAELGPFEESQGGILTQYYPTGSGWLVCMFAGFLDTYDPMKSPSIVVTVIRIVANIRFGIKYFALILGQTNTWQKQHLSDFTLSSTGRKVLGLWSVPMCRPDGVRRLWIQSHILRQPVSQREKHLFWVFSP